MVEIQSLGKIKRSLIDEKFGNIQTDDIIVTTERIAQIKQRHPEDYDLFENMALIVYRTRITSYKTENTKEQYLW